MLFFTGVDIAAISSLYFYMLRDQRCFFCLSDIVTVLTIHCRRSSLHVLVWQLHNVNHTHLYFSSFSLYLSYLERGGAVSPRPHHLGDLGKRCKLPQWDLGQCTERSWISVSKLANFIYKLCKLLRF